MKIEFYPDDLKPEYKNISAYQVTYKHLNEKALEILKLVGRGLFYSWDKQTYNAVFIHTQKRKS
jgi:hypothetical protein